MIITVVRPFKKLLFCSVYILTFYLFKLQTDLKNSIGKGLIMLMQETTLKYWKDIECSAEETKSPKYPGTIFTFALMIKAEIKSDYKSFL